MTFRLRVFYLHFSLDAKTKTLEESVRRVNGDDAQRGLKAADHK